MQAIKIYKTHEGIVVHRGDKFFISQKSDWDKFVNRQDLFKKVNDDVKGLKAYSDLSRLIADNLMAPIGGQEIWAAGVTYLRSREARMEESADSGAADLYDKVYAAERPELFFKSMPHRVVGHQQIVHIRRDSAWN